MKQFVKRLGLIAMALAVAFSFSIPTVFTAQAKGKIQLSKRSVTVAVDESKTITLKNAKAKKVAWGTNKPKIATVKKGVITGRAQGTAIITAAYKGKTYVCKVVVKEPVKINRRKASIYIGKTVSLKLKGATGKVTWGSSNKKIAAVNKRGVVTGKKAGTAQITGTWRGKTFKCAVTVKKGKLTASEKELTLYTDESEYVYLSFNGEEIDTEDATWSSSDEDVASVDDGSIYAEGEGECRIKATYCGSSVTIYVEVISDDEDSDNDDEDSGYDEDSDYDDEDSGYDDDSDYDDEDSGYDDDSDNDDEDGGYDDDSDDDDDGDSSYDDGGSYDEDNGYDADDNDYDDEI